jgi:hypothetical protein
MEESGANGWGWEKLFIEGGVGGKRRWHGRNPRRRAGGFVDSWHV